MIEFAKLRRSLPNAPDGYTPTEIDCPNEPPTVRLADGLSQNETEWLRLRRNVTIQPMRDFLSRMNIPDFDAGQYIDDNRNNESALPNIALAFSGGGWRALINGGGVVKAFDDRTEGSTNNGQLGGLLQSSTYVAGLSGGNWLVGSLILNNYTTVDALRNSPSLWQFENSILEGPPKAGIHLLDTAEYFNEIYHDVQGKRNAGYDASITDYWGRALSYQLINATDGGPSNTFSSIHLTDLFQRAQHPFPISIADARAPGQKIISLNSSVFEFNPFEMGTWDPTTYGFIPTQALGSRMDNGILADNARCIAGFDNAGFILGTSSSLFNAILYQLNGTNADIPTLVLDAITSLLVDLDRDDNDIADYSPNPFYGWNPTEDSYNHNSTSLTLVDGGMDNQNIPLHPLIQPPRAVDVIFANDNSADTPNNWPNGSSLVQTYQRSLSPIGNGTSFPHIPDVNSFINLGLNTRPTFFGCNTSNLTASSGNTAIPPLIVYLPNYPYVTFSNQPTFTLETNNSYRDAMIANGYEVATMANGTRDGFSNWSQCVACAVLSRSLERTGTPVPQACQDCFTQYCWDGTLNATTPDTYDPQLVSQLTSDQESGGTRVFERNAGGLALTAVAAVMMLLV